MRNQIGILVVQIVQNSVLNWKILCVLIAFGTSIQVSAQQWETLSSSPFPGRHHSIGFSYNGFGYVIAGQSPDLYNEVWKYTPETDSWEQLDDYSPINRGFGIGDMNGDKGYFGFGTVTGGGQNGEAKDLWAFDGPTESFQQLADCPCQGRRHPALVAFGDKIFMGLGYNGGNLGDWWEYDILSDTWTEKATFPGVNRHHPYQFVIDDLVYVGSGHNSDWYSYDASIDEWSQIASHPSYVRVAGAQFAYNGKGYTLSGVGHLNGSTHSSFPTGEFWQYDPLTDDWTELLVHPGQSRWAPAYFIIDGWVYMVAGETYDGETATYRYNLEESITDLAEIKDKGEIQLYPNPFENEISLPLGVVWINAKLYDISGAELKSPVINGNKLVIENLSRGIYVLEISDGENLFYQRIVKQ